MKTTLLTAAIAGMASATHIALELVDTFTGLATDGGYAESCQYDATDMVWRFMDQTMQGEVDTLPGSYPTLTTFMQGVQDSSINGTGANSLGIAYVNKAAVGPRLYVADGATGEVLIYDIDTENLLDRTIATGAPGLNGLCYDADNDVLYGGNVGTDWTTFQAVDGLAAIYQILDVSTETPTVQRISVVDVVDQDGNTVAETNPLYIAVTGANRVFMPNGCTVLNGMVYFVETRPMDITANAANSGALGIYDIANDEFHINTAVLTVSGDGIVSYGDYLIMSAWNKFDPTLAAGTLEMWNTADSSAVFETAVTGLVAPADIGINDDGMICVPSYNTQIPNQGVLYFVQVLDHNDLTTTELVAETTEEGDNAVHASLIMAMLAGLLALLF